MRRATDSVLRRRFTERRKAQRLKIPIPITYKIFPRRKILEETFCQDISGSGFSLKTGHPLKKGEEFKTLLRFPSSSEPIIATSEVVWSKKTAAKGKDGSYRYDIGMRYLKIAPKDRKKFIYLFCELMLNYFLSGKEKV